MNQIFFDESIHERGGFILGAYVYGPDAEESVTEALERCGLRPEIDEFKSSARMADDPAQVALREALRLIIREYRVGVLVMPSVERSSLGEHALRGLDQIANANELTAVRLSASFDRGIFQSIPQARELSAALGIDQYCDIRPEQDSRVVKGIQLADLAAHACATMLLEAMGLVRKQVSAGDNSGYDPDMELDLGFELWARLRYQFFNGGPVRDQDEVYQGKLVDVGIHGLHLATTCPTVLRVAASDRFGKCYLGCIH